MTLPETRYIFVTGGVASSLGKGLCAAALAALLQARGYRIRLRKLDPYLNVDPGTMSPTQHGEVFVTDDGAETDLDLGHYERFTGVPARRCDSVTTGQIYWRVLTRERRGDYLGATVQVIPHITDALKDAIYAQNGDADIVICEIGGTVGDIEGLPFLEAIRQAGNELGRARSLFLHLTLLPYISTAGELKTKPTQHSVKELLSAGIQPDLLVCRSEQPVSPDARRKIALFCNIRETAVIQALDADGIYAVPRAYHAEGLDAEVCRHFALDAPDPDLRLWDQVTDRLRGPDGSVTVAIVGKYTRLLDSYKSLIEALTHGGIANRVRVDLRWVDAETLEAEDAQSHLGGAHAILVPGGFGTRGAAGKLAAIRYARERNVPFLGICLGMQLAVIETARARAGLHGAGSTEFGPCTDPVISLMSEWQTDRGRAQRSTDDDKGGTMRLGAYPADLARDSLIRRIYRDDRIRERHRHRYEVNPAYRPILEAAGMPITGTSPDGDLPEVVEIPEHPFFLGVQFHPEFTSQPRAPHPLFSAFIAAGLRCSRLT